MKEARLRKMPLCCLTVAPWFTHMKSNMNHMEVEVKRLGEQKGLVGGGGAGESGK